MAHDVFISYASSDKAVADAVCSQLESIHRIRCWIAPRDVTPGASWAESIIDALDGSKIMVLIFSSKANASMQIEREVERAVHKGINIIPLRIEDTVPTKTLEYFISSPHWLDALSRPLEQHIEKLATSVNALLARQSAPREAAGVVAPSPVPAPVPGIAPAPAITPKPATASVPATTPRPAPAPPPTPAPPPVAARVPIPPRTPTPAVAATTEAPKRPLWLVPVALLVLVAVALFAMNRQSAPPAADPVANDATANTPGAPSTPAAPPPAATTAPASNAAAGTPASTATTAAPPVATASAPATTPAPAGTTSGPPVGPSATTSTPGASNTPARGAAAKTSNVAIELDSNLPKGSIRLVVDGGQRWTRPLDGTTKAESLSLAQGPHQVTVTLLDPAGEAKETRTMRLDADPAAVHSLKIRLSRFRRNLEIEANVSKPDPRATPTKDAARGTTAKPPATKP